MWQKKTGRRLSAPTSTPTPTPTPTQTSTPATDPTRQKLQELGLGWIVPKNGAMDFVNYNNPQANVRLKVNEQARPQVDLIYVPSGKIYPYNQHGEYFAVVQDLLKLQTKEEVEKTATITLNGEGSPDVIGQCGDKVRIYDGQLANSDKVLLYRDSQPLQG